MGPRHPRDKRIPTRQFFASHAKPANLLRVRRLTLTPRMSRARVLGVAGILAIAGASIGLVALQTRGGSSPAPSEVLGPIAVPIAEGNAELRLERTNTESILYVDLPERAVPLSEPMLSVGGTPLEAISVRLATGQVLAHFPVTPHGIPIEVTLGPIASAVHDETRVLVLDFSNAVTKPLREDADLPRASLIFGDPDMLVDTRRGTLSNKEWLGLVLAGSWPQANHGIQLFDATGAPLDLAFVESDTTVYVGGTERHHVTKLGFFVDGGAALRRVTVLLGLFTIDRPSAVTLRPSP